MDTCASTAPVIVLLAAGEGRRFGGIKQLAEVGGQTMLRHAAQSAFDTGLAVIVVTGAHAARTEPLLADLPVHVLRHAGWREGLGSSLAAGMRHLLHHRPQASAVLVCLADQPLIDAATLRALIDRHEHLPGRIIASSHAGKAGPPALFPRDCFEALLASSGDQGARTLLVTEANRVTVLDQANGMDVDTPADLAQACDAWLASRR